MKKIITFLLSCSICFSAELLIYTPKEIEVILNLYENSVRADVPEQNIDEFDNPLHRAYLVTTGLPLVSVDQWMAQVTDSYFELNRLSEAAFREKVQNLPVDRRRTDFLVYDVYLRSGSEEFAALVISRDQDTLRWNEGINLSAVMFEKDESGSWLRTSLPPGHWTNWVPIFNINSIRELEKGSSILIDRNNISRFFPSSEIDELERINMTE